MTPQPLPRTPGLILVEGLPGAGKSTMAHLLSRHFAHLRQPVRWWYEEERGHPLHPFDDPASLRRVVDDLFSGAHARVVATGSAPGVFALESLPFSVAFEPADGVTRPGGPGGDVAPDLRLRISGPELLWGAVEATYLRQPGTTSP